MRSSYSPRDVTLLLKDITGLVEPLPAEIRERRIQSGAHYSEMLPLEYRPSRPYLEAYESALDHYAAPTARAVSRLAEQLHRRHGSDLVLVSLARAGIPIGILLGRYLRQKYAMEVPHYAISIIRGRGIDRNAVDHILARHDPSHIQFVDGWIGKGAILRQLREALADYPMLSPELAVVSDPAGLTPLCGTHEDLLIPSSCLNATVTGLISRTFLREDIIGPEDFHGAAYYGELEGEDLSEAFLQAIAAHFDFSPDADADPLPVCRPGTEVVEDIRQHYGVDDINFIKPGIGEATRVLLRRIPWKILVHPDDVHARELQHIYQLAGEKGVPWEVSAVDLGNYKACGIIRRLSDL